ncbi:hypothetical protein FDUTEX481_09057 [Tolypothrix sp. PCC 7601]|nr:hypothetical protein FDUTEX481_09057 [Tolypothrix sp. PCC 7601]
MNSTINICKWKPELSENIDAESIVYIKDIYCDTIAKSSPKTANLVSR